MSRMERFMIVERTLFYFQFVFAFFSYDFYVSNRNHWQGADEGGEEASRRNKIRFSRVKLERYIDF